MLALWQFVVVFFDLKPYFLVAPTDTYQALVERCLTHFLEQLLDHRTDPHHFRRLGDGAVRHILRRGFDQLDPLDRDRGRVRPVEIVDPAE